MMTTNKARFTRHLEEAFEVLEEQLDYDGPYTDTFDVSGDGVVIPFEDGSAFRLRIDRLS